MTLPDLGQNWSDTFPRIKQRFPHVCADKTPSLLDNRAAFEAYLAKTHQLTLTEAHEEVDDFLYVEALHRELND
jgi:hypothetical protein